jgi:hypothetical protein
MLDWPQYLSHINILRILKKNRIEMLRLDTIKLKEDTIIRLESHLKIAKALEHANPATQTSNSAYAPTAISFKTDQFYVDKPLHVRGYRQLEE